MTKSRSNATAPNAKGTLVVGSGTDASTTLAVGTNNYVLTADSAEASGVKWAAAGGGANWTLLNTGGTALTGAGTITVSGISGADKIMILIKDAKSSASRDVILVRINGDTAGNYDFYGFDVRAGSTYAASNFTTKSTTDNAVYVATTSDIAGSTVAGFFQVTGCNASGKKMFVASGGATPNGGDEQNFATVGGVWNNSATVTSVSLYNYPSNFNGGSMWVYTSA